MRNPFHTPFAAVFWNEVLLNTKRVAPYAMMIFFSSNAVLWWGWGPAVERGWATNSELYIQRNFVAFNFLLGLPIFTAIMIGDIVNRDYRLGVDSLIFSKPVGRAAYLLGKFGGNFFVLVCCQSAFAITYFLLQWVPFSGMVTLPVRVLPYIKHLFFVVVISHLVLAAFYFAAGTLSRNAKVVYGLAACFYPAYIVFQLTLKDLPPSFHIFFDPLGFNLNAGARPDLWRWTADAFNNYVVEYSLNSYVNRAWMIVVSGLILLIVYLRFTIVPRSTITPSKGQEHFTFLTLATEPDRVSETITGLTSFGVFDAPVDKPHVRDRVTAALPKVTSMQGLGATFSKILAAVEVEFRLLQVERSVLIIAPLAIALSVLDVALYRGVPQVSYSITYASGTANALLLFLVAMIVFFMGEAMHRDREMKTEPVVWSTPAPNSVWLLSKFAALTLLAFGMVVVVGLIAIVIQFVRAQTPVDLSAYLLVHGVVVVPSVVFVTSLLVALNVLLRNKYVTYVVATALGAGLLYVYNVGYNHWLYNPLLYRLWTYPELTSSRVLVNRLYCLALAAGCLVLAHLFFERRSR